MMKVVMALAYLLGASSAFGQDLGARLADGVRQGAQDLAEAWVVHAVAEGQLSLNMEPTKMDRFGNLRLVADWSVIDDASESIQRFEGH